MNKQLKIGQRIESEHKKTVAFIESYYRKHKQLPARSKIFQSIAKDHLKEDPKYYSKLKKAKL
jgi:sulfur relay (sulfurtransferase) DsrC/TusE family protein